jgi:hypothetical protein
MRKALKIINGLALSLMLAAFLYVAFYCYLAHNGGYIPVVSGRSSLHGIGLTDSAVWEPDKLNVRPLVKETFLNLSQDHSDLDFLTLAYFPMVLIDWTYVHPSKKLI